MVMKPTMNHREETDDTTTEASVNARPEAIDSVDAAVAAETAVPEEEEELGNFLFEAFTDFDPTLTDLTDLCA